MKNKQTIIKVIVSFLIVSIVLTSGALLLGGNEHNDSASHSHHRITHNGYTVEIDKETEMELYNSAIYIMVPINDSKTSTLTVSYHDLLNEELTRELNEFYQLIDPLVPKEYTFSSGDLLVHFIVM